MSKTKRIGFVGVGAIAEAVITGLCIGNEARGSFVVSPRNAERAARLAEKFSCVSIAADNQTVLDESDLVFLAVTPQVAETVLAPLCFRADHCVVSFIATYGSARLREFVAPSQRILRMTPLPPIEQRLGPITLYPPNQEIAELFFGVGQLVQVDNESQLEALWAATGLMATYFGLLAATSDWLVHKNVPVVEANKFVSAMFRAIAVTGDEQSESGFKKLAYEHSTPGGLNEQGLRELTKAGWGALVEEVLDLIHARVLGKATFDDVMPRNSTVSAQRSSTPPENDNEN